MRPQVYLTDEISPSARTRLARQADIVTDFDHAEELDAMIIRRAYCPREVLIRCKKLKIIAMHGVGTDRIDTETARKLGIPVVPVPGLAAQSVAELAVAELLAANRQLKKINIGLNQGRYEHFGDPRFISPEIRGKTLGLVGTGSVAQKTAQIMRDGFGVKIRCFTAHRSAEECRALGFEKTATLPQLFRHCDFVSVHAALAPETRGMINEAVLRASNPSLILVNTARGELVDENALYRALTEGWIRGASSDVFCQEPPAEDTPLLSLENFIATCHIGGSTPEAMDRVGNAVVDHVFHALGIAENRQENPQF